MELILQNIDKVIAIALLILISITIRVLLEIFHQKWITTASHTATLVFLPILTYVITNVISGNIALSLGMVGALSIVRFRNPVTSPLELSTYFASITMGIAASVSLQWLVFLVAALLLAILIMYAVNIFYTNVLNINFFNASFSEGNSYSTLEITSRKNIDSLDRSPLMKLKKSDGNSIEYVLMSSDFNNLKKLAHSLSNDESGVISYQLRN